MLHILLVGHISVGFHAVGPFKSYDEAYDYGAHHIAGGYFIVMKLYTEEPV